MCIDPSAPLTELHLCGVCILYAQHHRITGLAGFVSAIAHYGPSRRSPVMDDGSLSLTARTSTSSSTSNYASRPPLSSVCMTLVAWARSRRFSQMEPHSGSPLLLPFLFPLAAQLPVHLVWWLLCLQWSVLPTTRTARAAIRVDRPTSLVSVSCLMPCLCIYTCSSLPGPAGAVRRDAMRNGQNPAPLAHSVPIAHCLPPVHTQNLSISVYISTLPPAPQ